MFDIGFSELIVIGLVALVVIGPERLPRVARTVGHLLGRLQRYVADVKSDIQREMQIEDLKKLQQQVADSARQLETSVRSQMGAVEADFGKTAATAAAALALDAAARPAPSPEVASPPANAEEALQAQLAAADALAGPLAFPETEPAPPAAGAVSSAQLELSLTAPPASSPDKTA